jgi:hypothetical protein
MWIFGQLQKINTMLCSLKANPANGLTRGQRSECVCSAVLLRESSMSVVDGGVEVEKNSDVNW